MVRLILGIIVGFLVWSVIWIGSDQLLISLNPDWYGAHQLAFERAFTNSEAFTPDTAILGMHLVRAVVVSLIAGFIAAVIAGEGRRSAVILGGVLLVFGIAIQATAWSYLPVWYHLAFLATLVPATAAGGRLRRPNIS